MYDFTKFKQKIKETEEWLKREFAGLRTGRATPALLDGILVESYGSKVPLSQLGSISVEDPRTIRVSPWEAAAAKDIEKAIGVANLGVALALDERGVRISFPDLTSERRAQIIKLAKEKLEHAKITLRLQREDTLKDIQGKEKTGGFGKDDVLRFKNELQKHVDAANKALEELFAKKEKEIIS